MSPRAPDPVDRLIARNIRVQRLAKGLSQGELGAALGITPQQVQKYERGANRITCGRLVRVAGIFGVPIPTLFDGITGPPAGASPLHLIANPQSFRLAQAYAQIDDAALRRAIVALVDGLAGRPQC